MEELIYIITVGIITGVLALIKEEEKKEQQRIPQQKKIPQRKTFKDIAKQKLV